ncbi:MAG: NAD(P)H-hydrate dehydratase [Verrucomicrobiota bacterium]
MKILSPQAIQDWEQQTIASGTPAETLMRQAVTGLHQLITHRFPAGLALIACGKGNNGNDALWLADALKESGWQVTVWISHPPDERTRIDTEPEPIERSLEQAVVHPTTPSNCFLSSQPVLIIDGILGLGAIGAPRGVASEMIQWLMQHRRPQDITFSIDTPSGLDAENGEIYDPCFYADFTVSLGAVKSGCCRQSARDAVGRLSALPITLDEPTPDTNEDFFTLEMARELISHRKTDAYKHQQGTVHLWAGSTGMTGAALLASQAALRSGAGLVRLFTSEEIIPSLTGFNPEIMLEPITLSKKLNPNLVDSDALLVGPGIGLNAKTRTLFMDVIEQVRCPLIVDADGITLCASEPSLLATLPADTILTPHAGEFARLLPQSSGSRSKDARLFTTLNPHVVLALKGPNTLVTSQGPGLSYNGSGNPGMATAGSGDVLAGLIAGLRARGRNPWDATRLGVFWHGLAGDEAARRCSEDSLLASDLIDSLGPARMIISRP